MLRPLLVSLGGGTGVPSEPTPSPPTPDAPPPGYLTALFLGILFDTDLKACFLLSISSRVIKLSFRPLVFPS
jgi:hypothetical protein